MIVSLIVAIADNDVIGNNNQLPWHLPADLKRFRQLTTGHPIIMGRKTFESIGKPLPNRTNIVISRQESVQLPEGVAHAKTIDEALAIAANSGGANEVFIIGGGEVYQQSLGLADRCYLTRVHMHAEGDTRLPNFPGSSFDLESSEPLNDSDVPASFEVYRRK